MATAELQEVDELLKSATFPRVKEALKSLRTKLASEIPKPVTATTTASSTTTPPTAPSRPAVPSGPSASFVSINDFAWDQGDYNSGTVTVYVDLDGVGSVKDRVSCDFTSSSFDLQVKDLNGKNYRLFKDNLDKDIVPETSKFIVKKDKVVVKLAKKKGEYSFESWTNLSSKKSKEQKSSQKKDPMGECDIISLLFYKYIHIYLYIYLTDHQVVMAFFPFFFFQMRMYVFT